MPESLKNARLDLTLRQLVDFSKTGHDIGWLINPYIDGIEVTQAIQYYHSAQHLTDAGDRQPDNAATLVARKPAWVRVYLRTILISEINGISGELVLSRRTGPFNLNWQEVTKIAPASPGSATATNNLSYAAERGAIGSTLNFVIPAAEMFGLLRLTVRIWRTDSDHVVDTYTEYINATLQQTLQLRGIFISYNGPNAAGTGNLNLAAPTIADLQATAAYTLTVDPVESTGSFASAGSLTWSTPLTGVATAPGGCSTQWLQLNAAVAQVKANDGNRNDVIYYGLLPNGVPIANVGGCESSGVSTGPNNAQVTMAHEVGHGAGLAHGPCGTTSGDTNYPAYEPYETETNKRSSIGEYGLNINNGMILSPANNDDYMSYCNQNWISLYHHEKLINVKRFNPRTVGVDHWRPPMYIDPWLWPWEILRPGPVEEPWQIRYTPAQDLISIIGIVDELGKVNVQSVMRVKAVPEITDASRTTMNIKMLGPNRETIAQTPLMRFNASGCGGGKHKGKGCGCGCGGGCNDDHDQRGPFVFQALLPDTDKAFMFSITQPDAENKETEVWNRQAPSEKPRIGGFEVVQREQYGYARWEVGAPDVQSLTYSLQFSKDQGRSWNGIAVGLTGNEYRFDLSAIPSGEIMFALLAHDGFYSVKEISKPISIAPKPAVIAILHPADGATYYEGQSLRLWASVFTDTATEIDPKACRWTIDGEEVQSGPDGWVMAPAAGKHECTCIVDTNAGAAKASIVFQTEGFKR